MKPEGANHGDNFIGFSLLADQLQRKTAKKGFEFTLMVVGESGLGKSTLVNSLFLTDLYRNRQLLPVSERVSKTTEIEKTTLDIEENGVKLRLTVVDTPGYGDGLHGDHAWQACLKYVDDQFSQYFEAENGVNRRNLVDSRVHCCLYFISPLGHGLKPLGMPFALTNSLIANHVGSGTAGTTLAVSIYFIQNGSLEELTSDISLKNRVHTEALRARYHCSDLEFMKKLQYKVNLVPVLAKADAFTKVELQKKKAKIAAELAANEIELYQFPDIDSDEEEEFKAENERLKRIVPFAVIGANTVIKVGGKETRGRQYPWGVVDTENPDHSDFLSLKRFLIQTHMQDLKDVTHDVHYENYRISRLKAVEENVESWRERIYSGSEPQQEQPAGQDGDLAGEDESHYEDPETLILLEQKDREIRKIQAMLSQMQGQLTNQSNKT